MLFRLLGLIGLLGLLRRLTSVLLNDFFELFGPISTNSIF
jgi:hypothetical protein